MRDTRPPRSGHRLVIATILLIYVALAAGRALTDSPGCDEGWFASPAFNLATHGHMGTTVIEQANLAMTTGIHTYTYWIMPLDVLAQALWYKVFGFGLLTMRSISILFGLLALVAWYSIISSLTENRGLAALATALIAVDFAFIRSAANGRMDMMCAALNFSAVAVYLRLRQRNFSAAVVLSNCLVAASALTHPNGLLGLLALVTLTLYFDRSRVRLRHGLLAAIPYLVGAAAYAPYVLRAPSLFVTQLTGNGGGRLWGLVHPLTALKAELFDRYLGATGGAAGAMKLALVAAYALGLVGVLAIGELRQHRGYRALLTILAPIFVYFAFFEGTKLYLYLVHLTPIYGALLAASCYRFWLKRTLRPIVAAAASGIVLLNLAGTVYVMRRDSYHRGYLPAVTFLNRRSDQSTRIFGTAELSFALERYDWLLDDKWLGYHSGLRPDYLVIDARYQREHDAVREREPQIYAHISKLLAEEYRPVYSGDSYVIYARD